MDQAEAFLFEEKKTTVEMEKSLKKVSLSYDYGVGIRAIRKGALSFICLNSLQLHNVLNIVSRVSRCCQLCSTDRWFKSFPTPKTLKEVGKLYDSRLAIMEIPEFLQIIQMIRESAKIDRRVHSINVALEGSIRKVAIVNTLGISCSQKETVIEAKVFVSSKNGIDMASGYESIRSRSIDALDLSIGKKAAEESIRSLHPKRIQTGVFPVVLNPEVTSLFSVAIGEAVNAYNVYYGRSFLCNRKGEQVGSDILSLYDDGRIPGQIGSSNFDAEGGPNSKNHHYRKGGLKELVV